MDRDQLSREELQEALKTFRQAAIFIRAYDRRALVLYKGLDVAGTIREVYESAVVMGRRVLGALGVEEAEVAKIESLYRQRDKARLRVQAEKGLLSEEARTMTFRPGEATMREP